MAYPTVSTVQAPTTELDAVNLMLAAIGESPVATLTGSIPADATMALTTLYQTLMEVLMQGWYFNSYFNFSITADGSGFLNLPTNTLIAKIDQRKPTTYDVVQKGTKFWDRKSQTYVFPAGTIVYAEITELIDFVDLPSYARWFVAIRAARHFVDDTLGADALHQFSATDEAKALALMRQADQRVSRHNMFDNADTYAFINRRL